MTGAERMLAACRGEDVDATPAWFMRQSGESLPGYLALRERHSVMDIARTPALCAEVTAGAAETLGTDAAVLFADVMMPVEAMGVEVELTAEGPVIASPVRTAADVALLRPVSVEADLGFVLEAIGLVRRELAGRAAVVGLAGGPFTIAAYMIEGRPSRDQMTARRLAHSDFALWSVLLDRITDVTVVRRRAGPSRRRCHPGVRFVGGQPLCRRLLATRGAVEPAGHSSVRAAGAPVIHFAAFGANLLEALADGADVVGVNSTQSLGSARARLSQRAVQGNLDPARLSAPWTDVTAAVTAVIEDNGGRLATSSTRATRSLATRTRRASPTS